MEGARLNSLLKKSQKSHFFSAGGWFRPIGMRGEKQQQGVMYSYVTMEQRIPADHPIRAIRAMVDEALGQMDATFSAMYSERGRPSVAPERLLPVSIWSPWLPRLRT